MIIAKIIGGASFITYMVAMLFDNNQNKDRIVARKIMSICAITFTFTVMIVSFTFIAAAI